MEHIRLARTELDVSRFIFGTASLFNAGSRAARQRLLAAAADAGFTHFDTAPYYGFGMAERDLAPLLRAHPRLSFSTKVGLYSPGGEFQPAAAVLARKALGRLRPSLSLPAVDFSIARAAQALHGSLRRTGRETVDLYMLHDPQIGLFATDEWNRWLQDCVRQGKVRHFGLALNAGYLAPILAAGAGLGQVIQLADSLAENEADLLGRHGLPLQITYGYVSAALRAGDARPAAEILKAALRRNAKGAIIVSTTRKDRVGGYARILEEAAHDR